MGRYFVMVKTRYVFVIKPSDRLITEGIYLYLFIRLSICFSTNLSLDHCMRYSVSHAHTHTHTHRHTHTHTHLFPQHAVPVYYSSCQYDCSSPRLPAKFGRCLEIEFDALEWNKCTEQEVVCK